MFHNVYLDSDEDDGRQTGDKEQDVASNVTLSSAQPQASKSQDEAEATVAEKPIQEAKLNGKRAKFNRKLCNSLIASDIPLNKLSSPPFAAFLEEISGHRVTDQSTLRKYYVKDLYDEKLAALRRKAYGQKIWVSLDETTDVEGRYVACFVLGILGIEEERSKCYVGNVAELERVNHISISAFFNTSLHLLWPNRFCTTTCSLSVPMLQPI